MKTVPVFSKAPKNSAIETAVTIRQNGNEYSFANLYLTEIRVINAGNQNIKDFALGISMGTKDRIVNAACDAPDRHHKATLAVEISPAEHKEAVDLKLAPFNRRDVYLFRILSNCLTDEEPGTVTLSSDEAVRFVQPMNLPEVSIALTQPAVAEVIKALHEMSASFIARCLRIVWGTRQATMPDKNRKMFVSIWAFTG